MDSNDELKQIDTHAAGATDLHQTRKGKKRKITPPESPEPGPYDTRQTAYKDKE